MDSKSIFTSKTFWLNVGLATVAIIQQLTGVEIASAEVEALVASILNIVVRFNTDTAVHVLPK